MSRRAAAWLAWSLCALFVALLLGGITLSRMASATEPEPYVYTVFGMSLVLAFSGVAARHPHNLIGWIFCGVGLVGGFSGGLAEGYATYWLASGVVRLMVVDSVGPRSRDVTAASVSRP